MQNLKTSWNISSQIVGFNEHHSKMEILQWLLSAAHEYIFYASEPFRQHGGVCGIESN